MGMTFSFRLSEHYPKEAAYVADITSLWSTIERLFSGIAGTLIGPSIEQTVQLLGSIGTSRARLSFIQAAGDTTLDNHALLPQFTALMALANRSLQYRNTYAHAIFAKDENGRLCRLDMRYPWRDGGKGNIVVTIHDLEAAWQKLYETYQTAIAFTEALHKGLPEQYTKALFETQMQRSLLDPHQPGLKNPP